MKFCVERCLSRLNLGLRFSLIRSNQLDLFQVVTAMQYTWEIHFGLCGGMFVRSKFRTAAVTDTVSGLPY